MRRPALTKTAIEGLEDVLSFVIADYECMTPESDHRIQNVKRGIDYLKALLAWHRQRDAPR